MHFGYIHVCMYILIETYIYIYTYTHIDDIVHLPCMCSEHDLPEPKHVFCVFENGFAVFVPVIVHVA